ncbi:MAG: hypothetical protein J0653_01565 [Deltaproteobacteria bacterium]|nr:hypothetical protein [Deltaproteobacteria bacterium]
MKRLILVLVISFIPTDGVAGWLVPSSYDECILKNMRGVTSDKAATAIMGVCRRQFLEEKERPASDPNDPFFNFYEQDAYDRAKEERDRAAGRLKK